MYQMCGFNLHNVLPTFYTSASLRTNTLAIHEDQFFEDQYIDSH